MWPDFRAAAANSAGFLVLDHECEAAARRAMLLLRPAQVATTAQTCQTRGLSDASVRPTGESQRRGCCGRVSADSGLV